MPRGNLAKRTKVEDRDAHESRVRYLAGQNPVSPKICHRMAGPLYPWLTLVIGSGSATSENQENALLEKARTLRERHPPPGLPAKIEEWPIGAAVAEFVIDVVCDRLRLDKAEVEGRDRVRKTMPTLPEARGESVPDWLFYLFSAAVLSTRLYYRIKSLTFEAPRRPDRTDDAVLPDDADILRELGVQFVAPCKNVLAILQREHVDEIVNGLAPEDVQDALEGQDRANLEDTVEAVLKEMADGLTSRPDRPDVRIRLTDLRALTEFAWFCFTRMSRPSVYPGWSDLLLDLSNYDSVAKSVGTPLFPTLAGAQNLISSRYAAATDESWRRIIFGAGGRGGHYLAAAEALNAQHEYSNSRLRSVRPPPTTAFVTSFDLELELSLLFLGKEFTVAMPVHVLNTLHGVAHTCWVGLHIPSAGGQGADLARLGLLREPEARRWEVLGSAAERRGPIVVRLAGCPLIRLPSDVALLKTTAPGFYSGLLGFVEQFLRVDISANARNGDDHEEVLKSIKREHLQLQHAIVINEHDAVLQSAIDLISIPEPSDDGSLMFGGAGAGKSGPVRRGLPVSYAAESNGVSRFWMLLGVQIHDSAVRHRLATLISSLPISVEIGSPGVSTARKNPSGVTASSEPGRTAGAPAAAGHNGLAVNKHLTALEQDLLFWNGFDIVNADVSDFTADLLHYANHLKANVGFVTGGRCRIQP